MRALEFRLKGRFLFRFGFIRGGLRIIHHEVIIAQKTLQGRVFCILLFSRLILSVLYGMPDTSRTCDLQLRKLTLYPSELRALVDIFTKIKTSLRHPPRKLNVHHGVRDECYYTTKMRDWVEGICGWLFS